MLDDPLIKIFVVRDDGKTLELYQDRLLSQFGGFLPNIGDEIAHTSQWIGSPLVAKGNVFFVVLKRVFMADGEISLVCDFREAIPSDYELF